jgi:CxxC motif-containing protein (DUF1111 family)
MRDRRCKLMKMTVLTAGILIALSGHSPRAQISFEDHDYTRLNEGSLTTRGSAQYLIHRDVFARQAILIGRILFDWDFADDKESGCNGLPCARRHEKATRAWPQSQFEASSCVTCHSQPAGSAGFGPKERNTFTAGNTVRTPDLFGAGLIQQLALEATEDLQAAAANKQPHVTANGVNYDAGLGVGDGDSVNRDLVVRPFGRKGVVSHLRAFISRAAFNHLGLQAQDRFQCPGGDQTGDGRCDGPVTVGLDPDGDGVPDELTQGVLSLLEHHLINHPIPGRGPITDEVRAGERIFKAIGCAECHRPEMRVRHDPRIEHITVFWNDKTNRFEAERRLLFHAVDDGYVDPDRQRPVRLAAPNRQPFVAPLYADLKRHEMGPDMADKSDEEGVSRSVFITRPLWGVGSYTAYLHDGSASTLEEAILRHGGEAAGSRKEFARLRGREQATVVQFLKSLILFSVEEVLTAKIPITRGDVP